MYRAAGLHPSGGASPLALANGLLGPGSVLSYHASSLPGDGALAWVAGKPRIYIRSRLSPARRRFAICHELAEWCLTLARYQEPDIEQLANALGAALLAPRQLFLRVLRADGRNLPLLAGHLGTTESCAALRLGETTDLPLALIAPRRPVRVRGAEFSWPGEDAIRRMAAGRVAPGLARTKLRDDPRRVVLAAANR
ncbi:MAG TPA: ImmA/IrrE family metallo-endopeptidase [Polyangiaceae bacterium]|nr:ImmA/IrrE family metallo-endopeptidase [Polyangiaceae bacterium]